MPSNRTSKDIDFVQPTQYKVPPNRVAKKPPPEPWELPDFKPLHIDDFDDHSTPNLPPTLNFLTLRGSIKRRRSLYFTSY